MEYILTNLLLITIFLISITLHEWGHAYMAYKCGDPTPKIQGRLSLNPLKHLDIYGTLAVLIFGVGWAKPVEFNPSSFGNSKKCIIKIALAGPVMNFFQVFVYSLLALMFEAPFIILLGKLGVFINLFLGLFNLLPFWPLDGFKVLMHLGSNKDVHWFWHTRYLSFFIFLFLLISGAVNNILNFIITHFFTFLL